MADGSIKIETKVDVDEALASLKRIENKLDDVGKASDKSSSLFSKIGKGIGNLAKIGAVGLGAVATGTIAIGKSALESYASYEQLVGGIDTLFKDSSKKVQEYAKNAYKTANMSANDYMETVTSFSASLIASLGEDTEKATEYSNRAIIDMSDNANKMGSSIESIQNAYQGFAKQNYTMLDNLKLGYGGTKEEMARLIADTSKMTDIQSELGVTVDSTDMSFGNIINAISVMQKKLDITGATALESATTIEGSVNTMKSAWKNMLTALANKGGNLDEVMKSFSDSVVQVGKNIGAVVPTILTGIGSLFKGLVDSLLPQLISGIPNLLNQMLPIIIEGLTTVITTIAQVIPQLVPVFMNIIPTLVNAVVTLLPMLLELGLNMLITLGQGIATNLPTLIPTIVGLMVSLCDTFIGNMEMIFNIAIDIIFALVDGLVEALPTLIEQVPRIINAFCDKLWELMPLIVEKGIELLGKLWEGIKNAIPTLVKNIPEIIKAIVNVWSLFSWKKLGSNAIEWIKGGINNLKTTLPTTLKEIGRNALEWLKNTFLGGSSVGSGLISNIINGISAVMSGLFSLASSVGLSVLNAIKNFLTPSSLINVGKNLLSGLWNGISSMAGALYEKVSNFASGIIDKVKSVFKIFSPSRVMRDEVGKMLVKGIGVGVDVETPNLEDDVESNMSDIVATMRGTVEGEMNKYRPIGFEGTVGNIVNNDNGITQNITIVNPERTPSENARAIKQASRRLVYG